MAMLSADDIRNIAQQIEPHVRRVVTEVVDATKQTFNEQSAVIMEQRTVIERLVSEMQILHDAFEPYAQKVKDEIGVEVTAMKTKQKDIVDHLKVQLEESEKRDRKIADSVVHVDDMEAKLHSWCVDQRKLFDSNLEAANTSFQTQLRNIGEIVATVARTQGG